MHPFIYHYQGSLLGPVLFDIFPNDLDAEAERIPSKFGNDAKLGGAADPWRPRRAVWVRQGTGRPAVAQSPAKGMPGGVWRGQEWAGGVWLQQLTGGPCASGGVLHTASRSEEGGFLVGDGVASP